MSAAHHSPFRGAATLLEVRSPHGPGCGIIYDTNGVDDDSRSSHVTQLGLLRVGNFWQFHVVHYIGSEEDGKVSSKRASFSQLPYRQLSVTTKQLVKDIWVWEGGTYSRRVEKI